MTKTCKKCHREKDDSEFSPARTGGNDEELWDYCNECVDNSITDCLIMFAQLGRAARLKRENPTLADE